MDEIRDKIDITNGEPSERILIIARNLRYAQAWCDLYKINPRSRMIEYVTHFTQLHGMKDIWYVDLGTDSDQLREYAEQLKSLGAIKPLHGPAEPFIGPQLPPDDILYRKGQMAREVYRHSPHVLKSFLRERASDQPERYLDGDYYVKRGHDDTVVSVRDYLEMK